MLLCCNNWRAGSPSSFTAVRGVDGWSEPGRSRSNNGKEPYLATTNTLNNYPNAVCIIFSLKAYWTGIFCLKHLELPIILIDFFSCKCLTLQCQKISLLNIENVCL